MSRYIEDSFKVFMSSGPSLSTARYSSKILQLLKEKGNEDIENYSVLEANFIKNEYLRILAIPPNKQKTEDEQLIQDICLDLYEAIKKVRASKDFIGYKPANFILDFRLLDFTIRRMKEAIENKVGVIIAENYLLTAIEVFCITDVFDLVIEDPSAFWSFIDENLSRCRREFEEKNLLSEVKKELVIKFLQAIALYAKDIKLFSVSAYPYLIRNNNYETLSSYLIYYKGIEKYGITDTMRDFIIDSMKGRGECLTLGYEKIMKKILSEL